MSERFPVVVVSSSYLPLDDVFTLFARNKGSVWRESDVAVF